MNTMKTRFQTVTLLLAVLFIASCSSDDDGGFEPDPGENPDPVENTLVGDVTEDMVLDADIDYELTGILSVEEGATLTIPAGTRITAQNGTDVYIVVQQGADIEIQGSATNPVVMTSAEGNPGDWGGLVILGEGITTAGANATAEVGQLIYGGNDNTDDSGSINYLVIKGAGAQINADSQYNGLTLYAVGSGTEIHNVSLINGADDGVEFFGGAASVTNLYLENNEDDAVDWTEGWEGSITNTYVKHTIDGFSTAIEADGFNENPQINNFTAVSTTGGTALQFKLESGATIDNLYLEGYETNIDMKDGGALSNVQINGDDAAVEAEYMGEPVDISNWNWVNGSM